MATKTELKVRYHYWDWDPSNIEIDMRAGESPFVGYRWNGDLKYHQPYRISRNPLSNRLTNELTNILRLHPLDVRSVTIVEDLNTGEYAFAILHPKDIVNGNYTKKLGRKIALGRLKKRLGLKTK